MPRSAVPVRGGRPARARAVPAPLALGGLALAALLAAGAFGPAAPASGAPVRVASVPSGLLAAVTNFSANVTWNGVGIDQAGSSSTAFTLGAGQSAAVVFAYAEAAGMPAVTNASLVLRYLDVNLSTESIRATTAVAASGAESGEAQLNWTFGSLVYLTQGVYEVEAELLDANGSVLFQEPFYVDGTAPFVVGSAITAFALVLGGAEAVWVVQVIRSRRARKGGRYRFH